MKDVNKMMGKETSFFSIALLISSKRDKATGLSQ
jgi:hypothetical protein